MITVQSMNALADELEKTSGLSSSVAGFLTKHKVPVSLAGIRTGLKGQYGRQMLVGAGAGGLLGGLKQPGYEQDAQGQVTRRSRVGNVARGALLGAGAVGAGALATKGGRDAAKKTVQDFGTRTRYQFTGSAPNMGRTDMNAAKSVGLLGEKPSKHDLLAHAEGWNTLPGVAKGMVQQPGKVLKNAWNRMDGWGKTITGIQAADTIREAGTSTREGGPGRAERVLGSLAGNVGSMVAPVGLLPSMVGFGASSAAGHGVGRTIDRAFSRKRPVPQLMPAPQAQPMAQLPAAASGEA